MPTKIERSRFPETDAMIALMETTRECPYCTRYAAARELVNDRTVRYDCKCGGFQVQYRQSAR